MGGVLCVQPCVAYGCHYGCFLSCMFEELCWLLEYSCFLPPEACPTCCLLVCVTLKVVYASVLSVVFGLLFRVNRVCQRVQHFAATPYSGMSVHWFFWVLYSVSGQCNWLMVVCSHCVLDVRLSSVIVGWLMAIWMNVGYAVFARWLFFFSWAIALSMCMTQPLSRCGVVVNPCVLDRFFVIFWVFVLPLIHCCPGSVRVTGYI